MTSSFYDQIEKSQESLRRKQEEFAEVEQRLAGVQATVTSKNRAITVTVDCNGEIADIKFRTGAYRSMPGPELARLLMDTIAAARKDAQNAVMEQFEAVLPDMPLRELMNGELDFAELMRQRIGLGDEDSDEPVATPAGAPGVDR